MSQLVLDRVQRLSEFLSQPHASLRRWLSRFLNHEGPLEVYETLVEVLKVVFETHLMCVLESRDIFVLGAEEVLLQGGGNGRRVEFGAAEHKSGERNDIVYVHLGVEMGEAVMETSV